jgi:hypothetical protein
MDGIALSVFSTLLEEPDEAFLGGVLDGGGKKYGDGDEGQDGKYLGLGVLEWYPLPGRLSSDVRSSKPAPATVKPRTMGARWWLSRLLLLFPPAVSVASLTSSWEAVLSVPLVREAERESTWF